MKSRLAFRKGFTLIELMVVIGIMTIAVAILIPVVRTVHAQASSTGCASVMQSIGNAIAVYKAENNGLYPYGFYVANSVGALGFVEAPDGGPSSIDARTYTWWSILRGTMLGNGEAMNNAVISKNAVISGRAMDTFNCPSAIRRDAGCDFVANAAVMIDHNAESAGGSAHPLNRFLARPGSDGNIPADVAVLWDAPELAFSSYDSQYVISYGIDVPNFPGNLGGMLAAPRKPTWRYRNLSDPNDPLSGDSFAINPGDNRDLADAGGAGSGGIRWRHANTTANFLFADGSVRSHPINVRINNQWTGSVTRKMFRPKLPNGYRPINF